MGSFSTAPQFHRTVGKVSVDPRLMDIMQTAAGLSGLNVTAFSGVGSRSSGTGNHPHGYAMDIELSDPATGKTYTSYAGNAFKRDTTWQQSFPVYEQFAQTARAVQQSKYPDLDHTFRWGGYWYAGKGNSSGPDMMHFDLTPTMNGAMGGGSWDDGASPAFQQTYGVTSNGGLATANGQRLVSAITQTMAGGGPTPPLDIPEPPVPRDRPASMDAVPPLPRPRPDPYGGIRVATVRPDGTTITPPPVNTGTTLGSQYAGDTPAALGVTSTLGWPDFSTSTTRRSLPPDVTEQSRQDAGATGFGAMSDPRTSELLTPQTQPQIRSLGSASGGDAGTTSKVVVNPAYSQWQAQYGANASGSPDDRDAAHSAVLGGLGMTGGAIVPPPAPPKTITVSVPAPGGDATGGILSALGRGFNGLKDSAGNTLNYLGSQAQAAGAEIPAVADSAKAAVINAALMSPQARGAIIDPMIGSLFTSKPGITIADDPNKYGDTFAERQLAAQNRDRLSQGLPPLPAASVSAPSPTISTTYRHSNNNDNSSSSGGGQSFRGSSTGRSYVVGQKYSNGNGTYVARADGSFQKVA